MPVCRFGLIATLMACLASCGDDAPALDAAIEPTVPTLVLPDSFLVREGETATLPITLVANSAVPVTVRVASSNGTAATVSPDTLTFSSPTDVAELSIVGVEDDGDVLDDMTRIQLTIEGGSTRYVPTRVADNDVQQIVLSATSMTVSEGGWAQFDVRLALKGAANLTLSTDAPQLLGPVAGHLAFNQTNYNIPQIIQISGAYDLDTVGGMGRVYLSSPDVPSAYVEVTVIDRDIQHVWMSATNFNLNEGTSITFTAGLAFDPLGPVDVGVQSMDPTAVAVSPTTLHFDSTNYNQPRTITIDAVEDADSLNESTTIAFSGPGVPTANVNVTVNDND